MVDIDHFCTRKHIDLGDFFGIVKRGDHWEGAICACYCSYFVA